MFMKIFTVLTISFNNIFTIPSNINNDETTTQLIRNKRQSNRVYDFEIRNLEKVQFWISARKNNLNLYPVTQVAIEKKITSI
ncbi:hypothetical protein [Spiroplasma endosymbiont of Clivina fossor]|uniref:hypothetical protein n=1 Tax=Spiroplasma endosymbiont of Clivina fossor TaxID=3066282 RepID=UPI00313EA5A3